jgi:hypothetical protein
LPDPATQLRDARPGGVPCTFVSGPRGAGKTRWIQQRIRDLVAATPGLRCGVVLAEDGHTRMERFVREIPGVAVRRVLLPCPCCPARAFLPDALRQLVDSPGVDRIFIESPATAAAGLLGEFDRDLAWAREVVLCLDAKWEWLRHRPDLPPFLTALLAQTDSLVPPPDAAPRPTASREAPAPNLILS